MTDLRINIIGAGRVGQTLAYLFHHHQAATIAALLCQSAEKANQAVNFVGQGTALTDLATLPQADIYFITTPDDVIASICEELINKNNITNSIIVHCSGALSADILISAKKNNNLIASVHPIKSFATAQQSSKNFSGTFCGLDGDEPAKKILQELFTKIGGKCFALTTKNKTQYHIGLTFASNYLITLTHIAKECLINAGIDENQALDILLHLQQNTLDNLKNIRSCPEALTGPIKRGDKSIVAKHLSALTQQPLSKEIYRKLGCATINMLETSQENLSLNDLRSCLDENLLE